MKRDKIPSKVLARMRQDKNRVYTSKDFLDLGTRAAIDQALKRLTNNQVIQKIGRGLYRIPRTNPRLGIDLAPNGDDIAQALGRKTGSRVVPSGGGGRNYSENLRHKQSIQRCPSWMKLLAYPPRTERIYSKMREMIFGTPPSYDELMTVMGKLEQRINKEEKNDC